MAAMGAVAAAAAGGMEEAAAEGEPAPAALGQRLAAGGQGHVLRFWPELGGAARRALAAELRDMDVAEINRFFRRARGDGGGTAAGLDARMEPVPRDVLGSASRDRGLLPRWESRGRCGGDGGGARSGPARCGAGAAGPTPVCSPRAQGWRRSRGAVWPRCCWPAGRAPASASPTLRACATWGCPPARPSSTSRPSACGGCSSWRRSSTAPPATSPGEPRASVGQRVRPSIRPPGVTSAGQGSWGAVGIAPTAG